MQLPLQPGCPMPVLQQAAASCSTQAVLVCTCVAETACCQDLSCMSACNQCISMLLANLCSFSNLDLYVVKLRKGPKCTT
jgi:hypothetical protein